MDSDDDIQIIQETTRKAKRRKTEPPRVITQKFNSNEQLFELPSSSSNYNSTNSQNACDKMKLLQTELEDFQKCVHEADKNSQGMISAEFVQNRIHLLLNILKPTDQELQHAQTKILKSQCENTDEARIQFWMENTSFPSLRINGPFERDVDIICEGGAVIPVHSDVLMVCSPLFKGHFESGRQPQDTVILLPDHPVDRVTAVVDFIYTGSSSVPRNTINEVWDLLESMKILPNSNIAFGPTKPEELDQVSITSKYLHELSLNSTIPPLPLPAPPIEPTAPIATTNTPSSSQQDMEVDVQLSPESSNINIIDDNNHNYEIEKLTNNNNNNNSNNEVGDDILHEIEQQLEEMHAEGNTIHSEQASSSNNNILSPSTSSASVPSPIQSRDDNQNLLEEEKESSPSPSIISTFVNRRSKPKKRANPFKLHFTRKERGNQNEAWRIHIDEQSLPSSPSSVASFCSKVTENPQDTIEDWPDLVNSSEDEHLDNDAEDDDEEPLSDSTEVVSKSSEEDFKQAVLCCYSPSTDWTLYQDRAQRFYAPVDTLSELRGHIDTLAESDPDLLSFNTHYFAFGAGDLASPDASKFFTKYGKLIKKLEIDLIPTQEFHAGMLEQQTIQRILTLQAPNVEYLEFLLPDSWRKICPSIFPDYDGELKKVTLENLTSLKIDLGKFYPGYNKFLQEILAAAPHLKNFGDENIFTAEGMDSQYLKTFIDLGKTKSIRDFDFEPNDKNIEHYEQFAQTFKSHKSHKDSLDKSQSSSSASSNQLRALGIDIRKHKKKSAFWPNIISILNILLKSNRNSLKVLVLSGSISNISINHFPQLPNLKVLQVLIVRKEAILPKNFQMEKFFPNLSTIFIDLSFLREKNMKFSHSFPDLNPVLSVKTIKIVCTNFRSPGEIIKSLPSVFPNLEKLIVVDLYHFSSAGPVIWNNFEMLKTLDLTLIVTPQKSQCYSTSMDTIFTGLNSQEYTAVLQNIDSLNEQEISELKRSNPSIIKLKALKNLFVRFRGCFKNSHVNFPHLLTKVSKKLAFDLMPDLNVEFSIDQLKTDDRKTNKFETSDDECYVKDKQDKLCIEKELGSLGIVNDGLNRPYGETGVQYLLTL